MEKGNTKLEIELENAKNGNVLFNLLVMILNLNLNKIE